MAGGMARGNRVDNIYIYIYIFIYMRNDMFTTFLQQILNDRLLPVVIVKVKK